MTRVIVTPTRCCLEEVPESILDLIDSRTRYLHDERLSPNGAGYNVVDREHAWDGWVRFLRRPKTISPWLPAGLRDVAAAALDEAGVAYDLVDRREHPDGAGYDARYPPIPLWDHQEACATAMLSEFDGVAVMPPRAGKTRMALEVVRRSGLSTVWVAPTSSIVDQTVRTARQFFADSDAVQVSTSNQADVLDAALTVCTASAALRLGDDFWSSRRQLVCDEAHHYLAHGGWGGHLNRVAGHIAHRKGLTGTFFRSGGDDMALHAFFSRVLYRVTSEELERRGLLVPCYSAFVRVGGPALRTTRGSSFNGSGGYGTLGIMRNERRNAMIADVVRHLSFTGRTVLVLVGTKAQGYDVLGRLDGMVPSSPAALLRPVEFVSTDRPKLVIREILDSFRDHGAVRVLVGTSMVGEGTDLPSADALVYAAGGKAAVQLIQGWYRVITKTELKEYAVIVDFADCHHRKLKEHSQQRWRTMASDSIFRMSYCDDLDAFWNWCGQLAPWGGCHG